MLWLILGIVLLIIAIAGGTIVHPILLAVAILALLVFFAGSRSHSSLSRPYGGATPVDPRRGSPAVATRGSRRT